MISFPRTRREKKVRYLELLNKKDTKRMRLEATDKFEPPIEQTDPTIIATDDDPASTTRTANQVPLEFAGNGAPPRRLLLEEIELPPLIHLPLFSI